MKPEPAAADSSGGPVALHQAASAWSDRGTQRLLAGGDGSWSASVRCHRRAVELMGRLPIDAHDEYLADLGTAWVNLGCALVQGPSRDCVEGALDAFERAIAFMERLPFGTSSRFRHNLAAGWMNRADALTQLGDPGHLDDAVQAYSRAIDLAGGLPLGERTSFRILLASCRINLGNLELRRSRPEDAVLSYSAAVAAMGDLPAGGHRMACHHAATAWANRGEALLCTADGAAAAVGSAHEALAQFQGRGLDGPAESKLSLRALRVIARGLESQAREARSRVGPDEVAALTDIAERGIAVAVAHRDRAPDIFEPFLCWFFSFGSRIYGRHQPQFLAEYLHEVTSRCETRVGLDLNAQLRQIALQAARGTIDLLSENRVLVGGTRATETLLSAVQELRRAAVHFSP